MCKITYSLEETPFVGDDSLYHYLYKIVNDFDDHEYIGIHSTSKLDDGYKGSGLLLKKAIKKYGIQHFQKIILHFCKSRQEVSLLEKQTVNEQYLNTAKTYNMREGGENGSFMTEAVRKKLSETQKKRAKHGKDNYFYGKHFYGELNGNYGNKWTDEQKQQAREKTQAFLESDEGIAFRKRQSERYKGENGNFYGRHHTPEHCQYMSELIKARNNTPEYKAKLSARIKGGKNPSARNVKCIETGEVYETVVEAAKAANKSTNNFRLRQLKEGKPWNGLHYCYLDTIDSKEK